MSQKNVAPKVSVCMLSFNGEKFISQAIDSFLAQRTTFDTELIISDDFSTDSTREIAKAYHSKYPDRIKLQFNESNIGWSLNYVKCMQACIGQYIAILDCDDYWSDPYKLQKQVDFLDANPDYGVVYTDLGVVDETGNPINWAEQDEYRSQFRSGNLFMSLVEAAAFIPNLTTCFRRDLIQDEFRKHEAWFFEDWWLWMRLASKTNFYFIPEKTSCYRRHSQNITATRIENPAKKKRQVQKAYEIYYSNILYHHKINKPKLDPPDKKIIYRKLLMLVYRTGPNLERQIRLIPLLFWYFPGFASITGMFANKLRSVLRKHSPGNYNDAVTPA